MSSPSQPSHDLDVSPARDPDGSGGTAPGSDAPPPSAGPSSVKVLVPGEHSMVALLGTRDELLRLVEEAFATRIHVRGNEVSITGQTEEVERVAHLFEELVLLLQRGHTLDQGVVGQTIRMVQTGAPERPSQALSDPLLTHRGRTIRPKTLGQKRYLDAMRRNVVTFAIGPAGTGKTYLAMAAAVQALRKKDVNRLILTRPAVEAGERLGFLPGTLHEKIDPYLKPLWDALHDMMGADELVAHVDRGTIEIAPLAYMRGRAQPRFSQVDTPTGFRSIGSLEPGDLVIGSDGHPTPVLGVYPQGRKQVFRLRTQDGASTLCCAEHLWAVSTRADRRRGKPPRVLETQEMIGRLRAAHYQRFELPLLSRPVECLPREVPMDPYALGLALGDGHDAVRTPSWDAGLDRTDDRRGGLPIADTATKVRTEPELVGTGAPFVPPFYLANSSLVRLALLQGLLDSNGGTVSRRGRTCRVSYTTLSARLRDDVVFLVRSFGGIASSRGRSGAHVVDIRLPEGLAPFRLSRKLDVYQRGRAGRPRRFVDSIEPAGEHDTVCIQVAASDSLYVTDDFLVTHNTLNDAFIVLDEAQNTTAEQMKMFLTRIGFGSKAVITGDISQVDLPVGKRSGLRIVRDILTDIEGVAFAWLTSGDVVRHHIVQRIVEAYERFDQAASGDGGVASEDSPQVEHG